MKFKPVIGTEYSKVSIKNDSGEQLLTVPRVSKLLLMYEPSLRRKPVVSVLELSDPARSIKF